MRLGDIHDHNLPLGQLSVWSVSDGTRARAHVQPADPRGPSHNQQDHIQHALARRVEAAELDFATEPSAPPAKAAPTGWIGVSFEVPLLTGDEIARVLEEWIDRHETLRSGFRAEPDHGQGGGFERFTLGPGDVTLTETSLGVFVDERLLADTLDDHFNRSTDAALWPTYAFATIRTVDRMTVVLAFDHVNVDGYSILLAVAEIRELVDARREGRPSHLRAAASYLEFVQEELAVASAATASHEAVETWRAFLDGERSLPAFPLPDGLPPGSQIPQEARCLPLLGEDNVGAFGSFCRANGVSTSAGFLAAMALAFTRLGGAGGIEPASVHPNGAGFVTFRSLVSTHTRHEARWAEAIGWFTALAPFAVDVDADQQLVDILPHVGDAWAVAKRGAGLPMPRIGELLDTSLQPRFVVSYLDARYADALCRRPGWDAHAYLGDIGPTDGVHVWINRFPDETYLTWRFPGNETCRTEVQAVTEAMRRIILDTVAVDDDHVGSAGKVGA